MTAGDHKAAENKALLRHIYFRGTDAILARLLGPLAASTENGVTTRASKSPPTQWSPAP